MSVTTRRTLHTDMYDDTTSAEIERILAAAEHRGLSSGAAVLRELVELAGRTALIVSGPRTAPQVPLQRPESTPPPQDPTPASSGPTRRSGSPGKPPTKQAAREATCSFRHPERGPCLREPHEGGRHRYGGDKRSVVTRQADPRDFRVQPTDKVTTVPRSRERSGNATVTDIAFSDRPPPKGREHKPIYDKHDHALIMGSNVVYDGPEDKRRPDLVPGWIGKIVEIDKVHHTVLVYGRGPGKKATFAEHLLDPDKLRWIASKDVPKAG